MGLQQELGLFKPIETVEHECLLNIVYTGTLISKASYAYFKQFGITDVQFNALMQLKYSEKDGISQIVLSRRLFVNRAGVTGIIDRLERAELIERTPHPNDRRVNLIRLTNRGRDILRRVEAKYFTVVNMIVGNVGKEKLKLIISQLEKIRTHIKKGLRI
jgi:DNA-binding MarR family transcriptional regulator